MPYAKKSKTVNGPHNNKAYMPVPKGYKGNWNVPKGTPWKKDSPYNPANKNKGPVSRAPSPESVAKAKADKKARTSRVVSRTSSPSAIAAAKKAAAAEKKSQATRVTSRAPSSSQVAAAKKAAAAEKKAMAAMPSPSDRAGSRANVKRAANANRASQRKAATASAKRASQVQRRGVNNKLKGMK